MNIWENAVITIKGLALQSKLTQGHALKITRAVTGTGYVSPGLLSQQTAVQSVKQSLKFKAVSYPEEGKCAMPLFLTNDGLVTGYTAMQVGIYAEDPDEGEILYFISQAVSGKGTEIPSETEMPGYNAEWTFYFQYGQADSVNVTVDPSNAINEAEAQALIDEALVQVNEDIAAAQQTADNATLAVGRISSTAGTYAGKYIRFATIDLSDSTYNTFSGHFVVNDNENTGDDGNSGIFYLCVRTLGTIDAHQIDLHWETLRNVALEQSVVIDKTADGVFDLYYKPLRTYTQARFIMIAENFCKKKITMLTNQTYVDSVSNIVATSELRNTSSDSQRLGGKLPNYYRKFCLVGSSAANSAGWYKVASQTMNTSSDTNVIFAVTSTYGNYFNGIFSLQMRADTSGANVKTAKWLARHKFGAADIRIVTSGLTWTLYINHKVSQYARVMFEVLSESSITNEDSGITLYNSEIPESTEPDATNSSSDAMATLDELNEVKNDRTIKTYSNIGQIGCTSASTPTQIITAMPDNSILMVDCGTLTDSGWNFPTDYGLVEIKKVNSSRVKIMFEGKSNGDGDYIMYCTADGVPTGEWFNIAFRSNIPEFSFDASTGTLDITL